MLDIRDEKKRSALNSMRLDDNMLDFVNGGIMDAELQMVYDGTCPGCSRQYTVSFDGHCFKCSKCPWFYQF